MVTAQLRGMALVMTTTGGLQLGRLDIRSSLMLSSTGTVPHLNLRLLLACQQCHLQDSREGRCSEVGRLSTQSLSCCTARGLPLGNSGELVLAGQGRDLARSLERRPHSRQVRRRPLMQSDSSGHTCTPLQLQLPPATVIGKWQDSLIKTLRLSL